MEFLKSKLDPCPDLCFRGKPCNSTVIQVYAPTSNAEEAEIERFYEKEDRARVLTRAVQWQSLVAPARNSRGRAPGVFLPVGVGEQLFPESAVRSEARGF